MIPQSLCWYLPSQLKKHPLQADVASRLKIQARTMQQVKYTRKTANLYRHRYNLVFLDTRLLMEGILWICRALTGFPILYMLSKDLPPDELGGLAWEGALCLVGGALVGGFAAGGGVVGAGDCPRTEKIKEHSFFFNYR
mmetsp:Transcript_10506/g.15620  ORF Transcript_10506/g.15620 Transcript_10506/m.15620 type:complete len:139 (-) Transcript_10506:236-652(-)